MKIIVCGCGKIGSAIIEKLSEEGHDVIVIDKEQAVVTEIANIHDVMSLWIQFLSNLIWSFISHSIC